MKELDMKAKKLDSWDLSLPWSEKAELCLNMQELLL